MSEYYYYNQIETDRQMSQKKKTVVLNNKILRFLQIQCFSFS